jgi:hypothetical protein
MDNKVHDAIKNICSFMETNQNITYVGSFVKYEDPALYKITFIGTQRRKIVVELIVESGSMCVLQTIDVVYSELSCFMNKFMEFLG